MGTYVGVTAAAVLDVLDAAARVCAPDDAEEVVAALNTKVLMVC